MKIMACTDGSETANKALNIAAQLAKVRGSELTILHVIDSDVSREEPIYDEYGGKQRKAKSILKDAEEIVSQVGGDIKVNSRIAVGPVSAEIVRIAEDEGFGALIIGSTGASRIKRMLLGSVADDVVHYAHCPVTVVR
jgi:nucleotide-binding universal stress UspA family protein